MATEPLGKVRPTHGLLYYASLDDWWSNGKAQAWRLTVTNALGNTVDEQFPLHARNLPEDLD